MITWIRRQYRTMVWPMESKVNKQETFSHKHRNRITCTFRLLLKLTERSQYYKNNWRYYQVVLTQIPPLLNRVKHLVYSIPLTYLGSRLYTVVTWSQPCNARQNHFWGENKVIQIGAKTIECTFLNKYLGDNLNGWEHWSKS